MPLDGQGGGHRKLRVCHRLARFDDVSEGRCPWLGPSAFKPEQRHCHFSMVQSAAEKDDRLCRNVRRKDTFPVCNVAAPVFPSSRGSLVAKRFEVQVAMVFAPTRIEVSTVCAHLHSSMHNGMAEHSRQEGFSREHLLGGCAFQVAAAWTLFLDGTTITLCRVRSWRPA